MTDIDVTNLFDLSYDQINVMKKIDLVNHIENLKGKVTVDFAIKRVCDEISQLSTLGNNLMSVNEKRSSQPMVISKIMDREITVTIWQLG